MSPRPSPCDGFTGNLPSYSDRELGAAELSALEVHLDGCARCQGRLKELETVSDVLKGWDARLPAGQTAGVRLQNAVLARIEEDGQRRRGEVRWVRVRRLSLAAAVLLAVGVPLALGLRAKQVAASDLPGPYVVALGPRAVSRLPGGSFPVLDVPALPPEALVHRPLTDAPDVALPEPLSSDQRDALLRVGLAPQMELEQEARFRQLVGMRGVWVVDPATGSRLYVTPEAAQVFGAADPATGLLHIPTLHRLRDEPYTGPRLVEPSDLGKTPGDLLRNVLQGDEGTRVWRMRGKQWHLGEPGSAKHQLTAFPLRGRTPPAFTEVLDPLAAQSLGLLEFAASGTAVTTVVAIVEGNELPIFLPSGQVLTGGETDRVVARPIWLPVCLQRTYFQIPCAVVRFGPPRRTEEGIHLTPWVAGPTLRGLLAAGASAQAVSDHVRSLVGLAGSLEWSLLDVYSRPYIAALLEQESLIAFTERAPVGFLVADAAGKFLGLEHVAIDGVPGALLRRRLLHGYALEGLKRAVTPGARSRGTQAVKDAVDGLRVGEATLRLPPVPPDTDVPGVVRGTLADASGAYEALRVGDHSIWISALPPLAR